MKQNDLGRSERADGPTIMEKIAYQRYIRGETVSGVAKKIGIDRKTLTAYELGEHNVPFFVVEAICDVCGLKLVILDKKGQKIYENCN